MRIAAGLCGLLAVVAQAQTAAAGAKAAKSPPVATTAPAKAPAFSIGPEPAWVVPAVEAAGAKVDSAAMHYRVIDRQLRIDGASAWDYFHVVRVVDSAAGLTTAAQIALEFDPGYQTFTLHRLAVVRQGKATSQLERSKIQLLQRETRLERQIYDGRMTMSVVLDDVRAGDEIDFSYSIRGSNPVFDGRFVGGEVMASQRGPVANYQLRLLAPEARAIQHRVGPSDVNVTSRVVAGMRETVFRRQSVAQFNPDPGAPASVALAQQVDFSEFADWGAVARWGEALFAPPGASPPLDALAAQLRAQHGARQDQILAALDFVQREVRYFGTEIGAGSHRPAAPQQVLAQRFGDCKDKVALLVALLHRLDVKATPVLVSTSLRAKVAGMLPSPLAFDHVIVRVDVDGTPYWLDATRSRQTGQLPGRQAVDFRSGLELAPGIAALSVLPDGFDAVRQSVEDTLRFEQISAEPTLESRITVRGVLAEAYRDFLATRGSEALQTSLTEAYLRPYPRLVSLGALQALESQDDDALTLVMRYRVPGYWRFPEERALFGEVWYWSTIEALSHPKSQTRKDPLGWPFPGVWRHTVTLEFPEEITARPVRQQFTEGDAHFSWRGSLDAEGQQIVYRSTLRLNAEQVEPEGWPNFTAKLSKLAPQLTPGVNVPAVSALSLQRNREGVMTELRALAAPLKQPTRVQSDALTRIGTLSLQISSGRLPPELQAQALTARGVQYDNIGRYAEGRRDLGRALALAPSSPDALGAAAVNAFILGDFARSAEMADALLQRDPRNEPARFTRARTRYFQKDYAGAAADLKELLADPAASRSGYPALWMSLTQRRSDSPATAAEAGLAQAQSLGGWPRPLIDYFVGKLSADALIEAARKSETAREFLCEAHFYIGERLAIDGDRTRAIEHWRKAADAEVFEFIEHAAARLRLNEAGAR